MISRITPCATTNCRRAPAVDNRAARRCSSASSTPDKPATDAEDTSPTNQAETELIPPPTPEPSLTPAVPLPPTATRYTT
jgi:hypothetical protein